MRSCRCLSARCRTATGAARSCWRALWVFVLATIGTLLAPNVVVFLLFRMLQAAVVTGIVLSRTAIRDVLGEGDAASRIGYVTMGMAVVPMLAPALGGLLDEAFGWRGSFGLMLIAGIAVLALSWRDMGETRQGGAGTFRAQFAEMPELMRSRRFWGYCATSSFASGAFFAYLGGAPFVGAQVFGMEPAMLGLFFGAPALGYAAGNFLSGRFAARVGIDRMILIGACINFGGMALLSLLYFGGLQNRFVFFGCFIFVGLGNGMILPSATSGMMSVRPHLAGSASGIGGAIMIGAGAALFGLGGCVVNARQRRRAIDRDAVCHHWAGGGQHPLCHVPRPRDWGLTCRARCANHFNKFAKGGPMAQQTKSV